MSKEQPASAEPSSDINGADTFQEALTARKANLARESEPWAGSPAQDAEQRLLLDELGTLGRVGRSIEPLVLQGYPRLLASPQVRGRIQDGASPVDAAHEALKAAIAALPTPLDRRVAEAILGATEEFAGKTVDQRKRTLDGLKDGCSPDTYKRKRPTVLALLVDELTKYPARPASASKRNVRKLIPAQHEDAIASLECVVVDAARLHYSLLACLFAHEFDAHLVANDRERGELPSTFKPRRAWRKLLDGTYDSYHSLIVSGGSCFDTRDYSQRGAMQAYLPPEVFASLDAVLQRIYELMPIPDWYQRGMFSSGMVRGIGYQRRYLRDAHDRHWQEWANSKLSLRDPAVTEVEAIASACADLGLQAFDYVEASQPFAEAAGDALELLADYYGCDADEPITGEQTLKDCALGYFQEFYLVKCQQSPERTPDEFDQMIQLIVIVNMPELEEGLAPEQ